MEVPLVGMDVSLDTDAGAYHIRLQWLLHSGRGGIHHLDCLAKRRAIVCGRLSGCLVRQDVQLLSCFLLTYESSGIYPNIRTRYSLCSFIVAVADLKPPLPLANTM